MRLLLLGGTADARRLAGQLHSSGIEVIYSVAGLVRVPKVDCTIVSGGFSQFGGLSSYLKQQNITALLDATHPYAKQMSDQAVISGRETGIACWRFHRPPWQSQAGDQWQCFADWQQLMPHLLSAQSVFITAGQLSQQVVDAWQQALLEQKQGRTQGRIQGRTQGRAQRQLLRTAVAPSIALPSSMQWLKAIGPFDEAAERTLMIEHKIDCLVSKNSGGDATVAKIKVARELGIAVLMLNRPSLIEATQCFDDIEHCVAFVKLQASN